MGDMLLALKKLPCVIVGVKSRHPKASHHSEIEEKCGDINLDYIRGFDDVSEGFIYAQSIARETDVIVGTGSLSVAAEIIENYENILPETYDSLL